MLLWTLFLNLVATGEVHTSRESSSNNSFRIFNAFTLNNSLNTSDLSPAVKEHIQYQVDDLMQRMIVESGDSREGKSARSPRRRNFLQTEAVQGQCDMKEIQKRIQQCNCYKPRERCVEVKPPRADIVSTMPQCVIVERCEGVCPSTRTCLPKAAEIVTVPVIFVGLTQGVTPQVITECSSIQVEKHVKCECACAVKKEDCNSKQIFNPQLCRCECQNFPERMECMKQNKFWILSSCECVCPGDIPTECSTGAFFNKETCKCEPIE
uniref:U76-Liphistoxin-Lth1a_1 n=1 Tax=Liphistius thaleban TaxID=1905330 RepID=A0A4Q8K5L8_9ARAC